MDTLTYSLAILNQVLIMAVLVAVGYALVKTGKLTKNTAEDMTFFVFKIATPCVIVKSFIEVDFTSDYLGKIAMAAVMAVVSHLLGVLYGLLISKLSGDKDVAVYRFGSLVSNAGFIALPLAQVTLGAESVLLISVYIIALNIFTWTVGKSYFKLGGGLKLYNMVVNPGTIGVAGGLVALLIKHICGVPVLISSTIGSLAAINTPIAMIITGYHLVGTDIRSALKDKLMWIVIIGRHFILPIVAMLIYKYGFGVSQLELLSAIIPICAPCAVIVIMMAATYGGDDKTACQMASFSTVLSVISMPLMLTLCNML